MTPNCTAVPAPNPAFSNSVTQAQYGGWACHTRQILSLAFLHSNPSYTIDWKKHRTRPTLILLHTQNFRPMPSVFLHRFAFTTKPWGLQIYFNFKRAGKSLQNWAAFWRKTKLVGVLLILCSFWFYSYQLPVSKTLQLLVNIEDMIESKTSSLVWPQKC